MSTNLCPPPNVWYVHMLMVLTCMVNVFSFISSTLHSLSDEPSLHRGQAGRQETEAVHCRSLCIPAQASHRCRVCWPLQGVATKTGENYIALSTNFCLPHNMWHGMGRGGGGGGGRGLLEKAFVLPLHCHKSEVHHLELSIETDYLVTCFLLDLDGGVILHSKFLSNCLRFCFIEAILNLWTKVMSILSQICWQQIKYNEWGSYILLLYKYAIQTFRMSE